MKRIQAVFLGILITSSLSAQVKHARHVILIGVDGLGAYAFAGADAPAMKKMMYKGAWTLKARSVLPSSSADNWASVLMGSGTEVHGYTEWDSKKPELPSRDTTEYGMFPTIFYLAKTQRPELKTAVIYEWGGIGYLFEKSCVNYHRQITGDSLVALEAGEHIKKEKPNLLFIHFSDVDGVGHNIGHNTPQYYRQVNKMDSYVQQILQAVEEAGIENETLVLLTADHGGINKGHGGKTLMEVEIPWIAYGRAVKKKGELRQSVVTYDTGATIAYLLGLRQPQVWTGRAVKEIF